MPAVRAHREPSVVQAWLLGVVYAVACTPWHSSPTASAELHVNPGPAVSGPVRTMTAMVDAGGPGGDASPELAARTTTRVTPVPAGMLFVPAGTFVMGSDTGGQEDERPAHRVTVASFFLDRTEVTNEAYTLCVSSGKCRAPLPASAGRGHFGPDSAFRGPEQPVSSISWDDASAYCGFVGKRLPAEAEFERAVRGDDGRIYPWGNEPPSPDRAVFATTRTSNVGTHPAGAGPYGHLDLAGNVWEWMDDFYDPYAYRRPTAERGVPGSCEAIREVQDALRRSGRQGFTGSNPIPTECEHVLRGGAFNYDGEGLRATNRVHHPGRFRLVMSGVRCAKNAE